MPLSQDGHTPRCLQVDGLLFGASDFLACTIAMAGASVPAALLMLGATACSNPLLGLRRIWLSLSLLMLLRSLIGLARMRSGTGPWRALEPGPTVPPSTL